MVYVRPPLAGGAPADGGTDWVSRRLGELREKLARGPSHERATIAVRAAELMLASARDEEAAALLAETHRDTMRARDAAGTSAMEIALAAAALSRDAHAR